MSNLDYKYTLRKLAFPQCAKEVLPIIEKLICGRSATSSKNIDLAMDLAAEFLFCEIDSKGHSQSLTEQGLKELQIILALTQYFMGSAEETVKNTVFLSLFGETMVKKRAQTLWKLVSFAVSNSHAPLLLAVGTWMQQLGCTSHHSLNLCKHLIKVFFASPEQENAFQKLGQVAPRFTANFMTGVAEYYLNLDAKAGFTPPPPILLEAFTDWVCNDATLCMAAHQTQAALPSGGIPMAAITPFAGLFKWCILAPLVTPVEDYKKTSTMYSKLYLGLLKSLLEEKPSAGPPVALSAQHLAHVVAPIQEYINAKRRKTEIHKKDLIKTERISETNDKSANNNGFLKIEHEPVQQISKEQILINEEFDKLQIELQKKMDCIFGSTKRNINFEYTNQDFETELRNMQNSLKEEPIIKTEIEDKMIIDDDIGDILSNDLILLESNAVNPKLIEAFCNDTNTISKFQELYFKKYKSFDMMSKNMNEISEEMYNAPEISVKAEKLDQIEECEDKYQDMLLDTSLDRLAQAVQVSVAVKCMYGSTPYLICQLESLPQNEIMQTIIKFLKAQTL